MSHAENNIVYPEKCGLIETWHGRVWMNPPYSNVEEWLQKFIEHGNGIALVNARVETKWFQRFVEKADAILFPQGRIQFETPGGSNKNPTVGSALVAYGKNNGAALVSSGIPWLVFSLRAAIKPGSAE